MSVTVVTSVIMLVMLIVVVSVVVTTKFGTCGGELGASCTGIQVSTTTTSVKVAAGRRGSPLSISWSLSSTT